MRVWRCRLPSLNCKQLQQMFHGSEEHCYSQGESGSSSIQPTTATRQMNPAQTAAALQLLAVCENDLEMQANAKTYGNWLEHLADQLSDERIEQLTLSCKHLHPVS